MDYSALIPEIMPDVAGAPIPLITRAIRESVREFCRQSTAYRQAIDAANLSWAGGEYSITIPTGFDLETVVSPMVLQGSYTVDAQTFTDTCFNIHGRSPEYLDANHPGWRTAISSDTVEYFAMMSDASFVLSPDTGTDRTANLFVTLVLSPSRTSTTISDAFGNKWFDHLTAGAKYFLMIQPGKPWSNPDMAVYNKSKWEKGIDEARAFVKTGRRKPIADDVQRRTRSYFR